MRARVAEFDVAGPLDLCSADDEGVEGPFKFVDEESAVTPLAAGWLPLTLAALCCAVDVDASGCAKFVRRLFESPFGFSGAMTILLACACGRPNTGDWYRLRGRELPPP